MPTYTNLVIMQGWLEIESVSVKQVNREQIPVLNGWIYTTDQAGLEDCFDERHPVLISGRPAEAVLEINRKLNDKLSGTTNVILVQVSLSSGQSTQILTNQQRPFVIAQGKLLSYQGRSCLDVRHLSVLGLPWGAFEMLTRLGPSLSTDTQLLLECLSDAEKSQIGQALGVALRSLVAHRQSSTLDRAGAQI
jgi:hypothetical protein